MISRQRTSKRLSRNRISILSFVLLFLSPYQNTQKKHLKDGNEDLFWLIVWKFRSPSSWQGSYGIENKKQLITFSSVRKHWVMSKGTKLFILFLFHGDSKQSELAVKIHLLKSSQTLSCTPGLVRCLPLGVLSAGSRCAKATLLPLKLNESRKASLSSWELSEGSWLMEKPDKGRKERRCGGPQFLLSPQNIVLIFVLGWRHAPSL